MRVKLISYSQPVDELRDQGITDAQELVAYCARVSNPANQFNTETSEKLIQYLVKHKHWSPLEMVTVCLEIQTTRDIAHQIVRHWSFAFQEFSQRYADPKVMGEMFEFRETRLQDPKNRQKSVEIDLSDEKLKDIDQTWQEYQRSVAYVTGEYYKWAISNGIAKEQARAILPEGLTKTVLYMNGSLRSWVHYIELRSDNGTQKEHMLIAKECAKVISDIFPLIKQKTPE
jgi:thymidylate synthase (FAD)